MGTSLGPTFANFYMCNLENKIFNNNPQLKLKVYCRYVDDILLVLDSFEELTVIKDIFQDNSILNFTFEIETTKKISFLDTLITRKKQNLDTTVFTKSTSTGECLNYISICPERYKIAVIKNFLHRAFNICSTWNAFHSELLRIQQLLVDNNFPNTVIEKTIQIFLLNKGKEQQKSNNSIENVSGDANTYNRNSSTASAVNTWGRMHKIHSLR